MTRRRAAERLGIGNRVAPARYIAFLAIFVLAGAVASRWLGPGQAAMAGFDVAAAGFLVSLVPLFADGDAASIREHARANDANRVLLLVVTGAVCGAILIAVGIELAGRPSHADMVLVLATLTFAWLFSNTVYALHYAHLFYSDVDGVKGDDGGLDFPKTKEPGYWDFLYFAWTLGMTFQTSDVSITGRHMRKVVTFHCLAAFVFNLGVLAFTINVLGG